ncbi:hypothetical protein B0T21DRAFT_78276 [Apiosordaria backusii]|uniref:Secreted protein n=1 Tax=Apiosordaria backusii TaxID=314023 RepID=A0AA40A780_9PEZI|nr:hypothetical protein B0T21DRAFT_78276 [Apiosordaria backusii]
MTSLCVLLCFLQIPSIRQVVIAEAVLRGSDECRSAAVDFHLSIEYYRDQLLPSRSFITIEIIDSHRDQNFVGFKSG